MKMTLKLLPLTVFSALQSGVVMAADIDTTSYLQPAGHMYFFEQGMPEPIQAEKGTLSLNNDFRKDGDTGLKWEFERKGKLIFNQPIGYKHFEANGKDQSTSAFTTWIYNTKANKGQLRFSFKEAGETQVYFDVNMNFEGWRQLMIPFEDMTGKATETMDQLVVDTTDMADKGTIYLDQVMVSIPVDPRWSTRDAQVPFVNLAADTAPNQHWLALHRYYGFINQYQDRQHESAKVTSSTKALRSITDIHEKLHAFALGTAPGNSDAKLAEIEKKYATYNLKEVDGVIVGEGLDNSNRLKLFLDKGINRGLLNDNGFEVVFDTADLRRYGELMLDIAQALQGQLDDSTRTDLTDKYVKLTRYSLAQGYAAESAVGTVHHFGYTLRALFQAHYLSRDLLQEHGLSKDVTEMMVWFSGTGRIYRPVEEMTSFNVDVMNTQLRGMLYSILMQEDAEKRDMLLAQFGFWLSKSISTSHGLSGGFKQDGSIFHHSQHYPAYAKGALTGLPPVVEALARTKYAIDTNAHETLKKSTAMSEIWSNDGLTLMSITGRHPTGKEGISVEPFQHMAMAGTPDGKQDIDPDMASAYLRLTKGMKDDLFRRFLLDKGFKAGSVAHGNWAMNYASMGIQRRDDWVAAVRGFSRYLVSHESYANANRYGRYINYGQLEIMDADGKTRAFSHDGWDWNRWPGTTAVQLPMGQVEAHLLNVDRFSGLEEMLFSEQTYAGAVSNGKNGLYAMVLQGHPKYDASFRANKSVFFFDNRIVALGSDIVTKVNDYPTQTTLFQHAIRSPRDTILVNGNAYQGAETALKSTRNEHQQIIDPDGNAYFVPGNSVVKVAAQKQQSLHQKNSSVTEGEFATAVIDHGKAPNKAGYEYAVLINPEQKELLTFASTLDDKKAAPYRVLQKDSKAHVVLDRASRTTGYAVFAQSEFKFGVIASVDKPAMLMVEKKGQAINLAMVNPDLNLYQGKDESQYTEDGVQKEVSIYSREWRHSPSQPVANSLVLKGHWQADSLPTTVSLTRVKDTTVVNFTTVEANPIQITLNKIK